MLSGRIRIADLPDTLLGQGRYTFTTQEAANITGWSAVRPGLNRLEKAGVIFSPGRGFYVVIPAEMRGFGPLPAEWYIDGLMKHYGVPYYVGLLSAAAYHGASHQSPQVFQVITDHRLKDRQPGRVRLQFIYSGRVAQTPTERRSVRTGYLEVSTKEATLFDLVAHPGAAAGFNNIATIARELGDLDVVELARVGRVRPKAQSRRVGWLLEHVVGLENLDGLRRVANPGKGSAAPLDPRAPVRGPLDAGWNVRVNSQVEPDL